MLARLIIALLLGLASTAVLAQTVYRWTDENGEVHYGHSVPSEHAHRGYERMGPDGTVRARIPRSLTAEERAERNAQRAQELEEEAERRSQESRDRLLLAAYQSEQDIENNFQVQLDTLNSQRASVRQSLNRATARFESLVAQAAQLNRDGDIVPPRLSNSIQDARSESRRLRASLEDLDLREEELRVQYEAELARFRLLTGSD